MYEYNVGSTAVFRAGKDIKSQEFRGTFFRLTFTYLF